jgi:quercetin dioxygenase-like cupin family protein
VADGRERGLGLEEKPHAAGALTMMETNQTGKWSGTPERLVAPMAGPVLEFDLSQELALLHRESEWKSFGRNSKTLVKQPDLRVVLTALRRDAHIAEHTTRARICVHTLSGHVRMHAGGRVFDLPQGHLLALDWGMPRDIEALEDSAFLMTLTWDEGVSH